MACASVGDAFVAPLSLATTVLVASVVPDTEAVDVRVDATVEPDADAGDVETPAPVVVFAYTYPE